jgi:hypothetical protein
MSINTDGILVFLDSSPKKKERIITKEAIMIILYELKISIVEILLLLFNVLIQENLSLLYE